MKRSAPDTIASHTAATRGTLRSARCPTPCPSARLGLGLEVELEYSTRGGTPDGVGATTYQSGQLGGNFVLSF